MGAVVVAAPADRDILESREAGFKLVKPANWVFVPTKSVAQHLAMPKLKDKELEKQIRSKPNVPFLVIARFEEPYEGLNPSVQVALKTQGELLGQGVVALLKRIVERLKGNFDDFVLVEPAMETTVDGKPAGRMVGRYTVTDDRGKEFNTKVRMWVVPRGEYLLTISMYGPSEGPNTFEQEFAGILRSIQIAER